MSHHSPNYLANSMCEHWAEFQGRGGIYYLDYYTFKIFQVWENWLSLEIDRIWKTCSLTENVDSLRSKLIGSSLEDMLSLWLQGLTRVTWLPSRHCSQPGWPSGRAGLGENTLAGVPLPRVEISQVVVNIEQNSRRRRGKARNSC